MDNSILKIDKTYRDNYIKRPGFINNLLRYKYYYLLMLPGIVYFIMFKYIPIAGLILAFKNYRFADGILGSPWAGFKWFEQLFTMGDFVKIIWNTIIISFLKLIFNFPAPIILALLLNELHNKVYKKLVQTVVYLPHFISWVVISGLMVVMLSPSVGILSVFNIRISPLMEPKYFRGILVLSSIWKDVGWGSIIYLAAISGINPELYESALIDGANRFQRIKYITVPSIMGTAVVLFILRTGQILNAGFDQVYMLYSPLVYDTADIIDTYVYRTGIAQGRFSYATAGGLFKSVVGLIMVLFTNWVAKRAGEDGLW